ncbi:MerR family transcriptional regulator [Amycolatopsis viridis]|uniref:DNA-binding transcriptional MerR regulator n=1 Tax=Amycolatopsis viridis TaxID=185678 RepID=A0ABX0SR64_9PSEU|nr:MerR family transcriptional regulator [Amycolatopsis viridis]NIH78149.1 DNA-binding transcriptional MerR regulator [Amycolatopsis viridis]
MGRVDGTFTIGELSRRTGLPVKTIRFYSDEGLLPPADRTGSGYRLYDVTAMARLELIKTLRELGLGLAEVSAVLDRETSVSRLAQRHLDALDEQIRRLRLRRAVLRAFVKRKSELAEVELMNKLAAMSDEERARLVAEFWREMTDGLAVDTGFYERMRSAKPELPDDPSPEQLEAWIEFAELIQDPEFRAAIRRMSERHADAVGAGAEFGPPPQEWFAWSERAQQALEAGLPPESPEGRALADDVARTSARDGQDPADHAFRASLADRIAAGTDGRAERYWQLMAIMNGWPEIPARVPAVEWLTAALRA